MLDNFGKYLKIEKRYSVHTVKAYLADIKEFFNYAELLPNNADMVNRQLIRGWVSLLLNGKGEKTKLSARSVNRKIASLRSFYNYLRRQNIINYNPLSKIISPKISKRLPVFLKEDKLNKDLDAKMPDENYDNIRNKTILEVLYGTGMRVSELVKLQCNDIDFSGKLIKVNGKGNKQRYIPLSAHLESIMANYMDSRTKYFGNLESNTVFLTSKSKPIYVKLVYLIVRCWLSSCGYTEKKSPHVLRHSFATHLLNHEADINGIKELLGHANLSATQIYTHNSFQKMKIIYKKAHPHADSEE